MEAKHRVEGRKKSGARKTEKGLNGGKSPHGHWHVYPTGTRKQERGVTVVPIGRLALAPNANTASTKERKPFNVPNVREGHTCSLGPVEERWGRKALLRGELRGKNPEDSNQKKYVSGRGGASVMRKKSFFAGDLPLRLQHSNHLDDGQGTSVR